MTNYQAELLTAIVSGTSRRNVLGAIALKRTIATSRSEATTTETNPEKATKAIYRRLIGDQQTQKNRRLRQALPLRKKPGWGPFPLDRLFQERSDTPPSLEWVPLALGGTISFMLTHLVRI